MVGDACGRSPEGIVSLKSGPEFEKHWYNSLNPQPIKKRSLGAYLLAPKLEQEKIKQKRLDPAEIWKFKTSLTSMEVAFEISETPKSLHFA